MHTQFSGAVICVEKVLIVCVHSSTMRAHCYVTCDLGDLLF